MDKSYSNRGGTTPDDSCSDSHRKQQKESESTSSVASLNLARLDKDKIVSANAPEVTNAFARGGFFRIKHTETYEAQAEDYTYIVDLAMNNEGHPSLMPVSDEMHKTIRDLDCEYKAIHANMATHTFFTNKTQPIISLQVLKDLGERANACAEQAKHLRGAISSANQIKEDVKKARITAQRACTYWGKKDNVKVAEWLFIIAAANKL